jgi:SNF2 family DNA or RNA helicase
VTLRELPYQDEGAAFLASHKTALLADDPRLGKTIQSIKAADLAQALKVLVICPAGVVTNWKREIARHRRGDWSAFVTSYEKATGSDYKRILAQEWCVAIIDEAHYAKNLTAKRTKALYGTLARAGDKAIVSRALQVWLLTGTPMPNHAGELYPHLRALYPQAITSERTGQPWTYMQFVQRYCLLKSNGFGEQIVGSKNEDVLHAKLAGFMLRRRKKDVLHWLPPTTFEDLYIDGDLSGLPGEEIETARKALAEEGIEGLRRVAANGSVSTLRRLVGMAKVPAMRAWLADWLESAPADEKIVVFAHHTDVIESLYDGLHKSFVRISNTLSGVGGKARQIQIDRFRDDPSVRGIICRMSAEGVGISLARASEMVVVEPAWVPATNDQVYERIVDLGKTDPNTVRTAVIAGSIDEDIMAALSRKRSSIGAVIDGEKVAR